MIVELRIFIFALRGQNPFGQALHVTAVAGKRRCRMHSGAAGSGAPHGNKNALKHGRFTREAIAKRRQAATGSATAIAQAHFEIGLMRVVQLLTAGTFTSQANRPPPPETFAKLASFRRSTSWGAS